MNTLPSGISVADWLATPASVRTLILSEPEEIDQLRERISHSSRNSSKSLSSDGPGFKPPALRKGSGRKRSG